MTLGPLPILIVPMLAGAVAYVLRRWRLVPPLVGTGVALVIGIVLMALPLGDAIEVGGSEIFLEEPVVILGRELVLTPPDRLAMVFLFFTGAGLFALSTRFDQGDLFVPLGLGLLGLLCGVLLIRPLIYAALLLQVGAALSIFPLHAEERPSTRGGLRYLTFNALALPGLLISHWLLDIYAVSPDQIGLLYTSAALIGLSFALVLGLFPFHAWVPAVGSDGAPLMSAFLYTVGAGSVWFLLLDYVQTYPWLSGEVRWNSLLSTIGIATAVVGGVLGMTRRNIGSLMGYAVLVDTGLVVTALSLDTQSGGGLSIGILVARAIGVPTMAAGLAGLRALGEDDVQLPDGIGRRAPWSTLAVFVGGLSMAGFPLTVGFAMRWALFSKLFSDNPSTGLILLLVSFGPLVGLLQLMTRLLQQPPKLLGKDRPKQEEQPIGREPLASVVLLCVLMASVVVLGLFPQPLARFAVDLASYFDLLAP